MGRRHELDLLRGLMLVLMFVTHMPTRFSNTVGQPFGYVSAAEGFVALSAFMAGMVYTWRAEQAGIPAMRRAFFSRALTIYGCQVILLLLLFSVIAALGMALRQPALLDLLGFYLEHPTTGLLGGLLLIYDPPLLDILPMYIVLLLASPFIMSRGLRRGWTGILVASVALWTMAQFDVSRRLYTEFVEWTSFPVPFRETGAFETYAWQLPWVLGLWLGSMSARGQLEKHMRFPPYWVVAACLYAITCLLWRHFAGQAPIPDGGDSIINRLFDKWHLGPLRLLNALALAVLLMHFSGWLKLHVPRVPFLEKLGAASLPVFCVHLVMVLVTLSLFGPSTPERPMLLDVFLLAIGLAGLYLAAQLTLWLDREERARKKGGKEKAARRALTSVAKAEPLAADAERMKP